MGLKFVVWVRMVVVKVVRMESESFILLILVVKLWDRGDFKKVKGRI